MVLKNDKAHEAEAIIKELSLFSFSKEALTDGHTEDIGRFEVLMSRYASLKGDPALSDLVGQLEDKYQISKDITKNVETYNQLKNEILTSKQVEEFNDREQLRLREGAQMDIAQLSTEEQVVFLTKEWQAVETAAINCKIARKELAVADKKLADTIHKMPSDRRAIAFALMSTRGLKEAQKFIETYVNPSNRSEFKNYQKEWEKLCKENGGLSPCLIRKETGRPLFPLDEQYRQNMGKDVLVVVSDEGAENILASTSRYANEKMASAFFNNTVRVFNENYGKVSDQAKRKIGSLNVSPEFVAVAKEFFPSVNEQGGASVTVDTWLNQINQGLMKVPQGNVTNRLQQASDGKGQRFSGVCALLDGLQESLPDQNKGVSTVEKTFKLR